MKLLIFTPTYEDYTMRPEVEQAIRAQLNGGAWVVGRENPWPVPDMRNVTAQYQAAWRMVIEDGYEALLTVEHDIRIPPQAIERLMATAADVVYGVYLFRTWPALNAWRYENQTNLGMSLSNYPRELERMRQAGAGLVSGIGMGCTLIRRHVIEQIPLHDNPDGGACDIPFAEDCLRKGLRAVARFDVLCSHWTGKRWVTPFERDLMKKYLILETVNATANGRFMRLHKGLMIDLTDEEAADLLPVGYVRLVEDAAPGVEEATRPATEEATAAPQRRKKKTKSADDAD